MIMVVNLNTSHIFLFTQISLLAKPFTKPLFNRSEPAKEGEKKKNRFCSNAGNLSQMLVNEPRD